MNQWNKVEISEIYPTDFDKGVIQRRLFSKWYWNNYSNQTSTYKKKNNTDLTPFMKLIQWFRDLNVKYKPIKLIGDNTGGNTDHLGFGDGFLDKTPKA